MVERSQNLPLMLKPTENLFVRCEDGPDDLQRYRLDHLPYLSFGQIDCGHPTRPDLPHNAIRPNTAPFPGTSFRRQSVQDGTIDPCSVGFMSGQELFHFQSKGLIAIARPGEERISTVWSLLRCSIEDLP